MRWPALLIAVAACEPTHAPRGLDAGRTDAATDAPDAAPDSGKPRLVTVNITIGDGEDLDASVADAATD